LLDLERDEDEDSFPFLFGASVFFSGAGLTFVLIVSFLLLELELDELDDS